MAYETTATQLRDAIQRAEAAADGDSNDRELSAWQEVGELASKLLYLTLGDDRTYSVTVTGDEEDDGEAPYVFVVDSDGEADAKRQALIAWCELMADTYEDGGSLDPRKVEVTRGLPEFGAYNDLRPGASD